MPCADAPLLAVAHQLVQGLTVAGDGEQGRPVEARDGQSVTPLGEQSLRLPHRQGERDQPAPADEAVEQ